MLSVRGTIQLNSLNQMQVGSDMLSRKIQSNYQLMGKSITASDLLHMATVPPEVYVGQEVNQYMLINEQNYITNEQHLEMINSFLNRMMLFGTENFTFQDEVYVTSVLQKLGIINVNEFMTEIKQQLQEQQHLKELVQKYEKNESRIYKFLQSMQNITQKQTTDIINQEKYDTSRFFLQNKIYDRMQTKEWNRFLYETKKYSFLNDSKVTSQELSFSEKLLMADVIELRQLKQKLLQDSQPAEYSHFHFYEQIPIPEEQITEQTVLRFLGAAILTNLVKNLNYIRVKSEKADNWIEYTTAFYGNSNDTIERFEDAHMQTHKYLYQQQRPFYSMNKLYESELNILTMLENNQEEINEEIYPSVQMINALLQIQNKEKQAVEYIYTGSQIPVNKEIEDYRLIENLKAEEQLLKTYQHQITEQSRHSSYPFIEKILEKMEITERSREEKLEAVTEILQQLPLQMLSENILLNLSEQVLKKEYSKRIEEKYYQKAEDSIKEISGLLKNITGNVMIEHYFSEAVSIQEEKLVKPELVYTESEEFVEQEEEKQPEPEQSHTFKGSFVEEIIEQIETEKPEPEIKQILKEVLQQLPRQMQSREVLVLFAEQILKEEYQRQIKTDRYYQQSHIVTELADRVKYITGNEAAAHFLEKAMQLQNETMREAEKIQEAEQPKLKHREEYREELFEMPYLSEIIRETVRTEQYNISQTQQIKEREVLQINKIEEALREHVDFSTLSLKEQKVYLDKINERNMLRRQLLEQSQAEVKKEHTILVDKKAAMKKTLAALENPEQAVAEVLMHGEAISVEKKEIGKSLELIDVPLRKYYEKILKRSPQTISEEENRKEILKFEHILSEIADQEIFRKESIEENRIRQTSVQPQSEEKLYISNENIENVNIYKESWEQAEQTIDKIREIENVTMNEREESAFIQAELKVRKEEEAVLEEQERLLQMKEEQQEYFREQQETEIQQQETQSLVFKKMLEQIDVPLHKFHEEISKQSQQIILEEENQKEILKLEHVIKGISGQEVIKEEFGGENLIRQTFIQPQLEEKLYISDENAENISIYKESWEQAEQTIDKIREIGNVVVHEGEQAAFIQAELQVRRNGEAVLEEEERLLQVTEEQQEYLQKQVETEILQKEKEHFSFKKNIEHIVSGETFVKDILSQKLQHLMVQDENQRAQQILQINQNDRLPLEHDYRYAEPQDVESQIQFFKEQYEKEMLQKESWKELEQRIEKVRENGAVTIKEIKEAVITPMELKLNTIHSTVPAVFETVEELQQVQTVNYLHQNANRYVIEESAQLIHKQKEQHLDQEELEELLAEHKTILTQKEVKTELVNYSTTLEQRIEETKEELMRQNRKSVTELIQNNLMNQMNMISDQVYQKLEHKLLNERKRRGY